MDMLIIYCYYSFVDVCQIRLDFDTTTLADPSTTSGSIGECSTDSLTVTSPSSYYITPLCGDIAGTHSKFQIEFSRFSLRKKKNLFFRRRQKNSKKYLIINFRWIKLNFFCNTKPSFYIFVNDIRTFWEINNFPQFIIR